MSEPLLIVVQFGVWDNESNSPEWVHKCRSSIALLTPLSTGVADKEWNYFKFPEGIKTRFVWDANGNAELLLLVGSLKTRVSSAVIFKWLAFSRENILYQMYSIQWSTAWTRMRQVIYSNPIQLNLVIGEFMEESTIRSCITRVKR